MKRILFSLIALSIISCSKEDEIQKPTPVENMSGKIQHRYGSVYNGGFNDFTTIIKVLPEDKILVVGNFTQYKDKNFNRIIRLNKDGSIDESFNSGTGFDNYPMSVAIQLDGKYIIVGKFKKYNGVIVNNIVRLNPDGTIDTSFKTGSGFYDPQTMDEYKWFGCVTIDNSGKILIGGNFLKYNDRGYERIIRLNPNGTIDQSFFFYTIMTSVVDIAVDKDNSIYVSYVGTSGKSKLLKLNNDGSEAIDFDNSTINQLGWGRIKLWNDKFYYFDLRDGKVYILSKLGKIERYTNYGGADFAFQSNGKIIIGGYNLFRLNQDLSVDYTFNFGGTGFEGGVGYTSSISDIAVQSDDNILVGGGFKIYNTDGGSANLIRLYK